MGGMGGGGGSVEIPQRDFHDEWQDIKFGYKGQIGQFNKFRKNDPLLSGATDVAQGGLDEVASLQDPLKKYLGSFADTGYLNDIIKNQGALTTEGMRAADQAALGLAAGAGMGNANAGIAGALLNREQFRTDRLNNAFQERGMDLAQRLGATAGIQGVRSQAIQPALATTAGAVGAFGGLTNPILAYLSDLNSSNQNAAAAQSIASANQSAGKSSGTMGAITSVIGAAATAY